MYTLTPPALARKKTTPCPWRFCLFWRAASNMSSSHPHRGTEYAQPRFSLQQHMVYNMLRLTQKDRRPDCKCPSGRREKVYRLRGVRATATTVQAAPGESGLHVDRPRHSRQDLFCFLSTCLCVCVCLLVCLFVMLPVRKEIVYSIRRIFILRISFAVLKSLKVLDNGPARPT